MFYYGEIGYQFDGGSHNLETAEKEAIKRSEKIDVVGIFDQHEELISVAIDGQIFEPRKSLTARSRCAGLCLALFFKNTAFI